MNFYKNYLKRTIDIIVAGTILITLSIPLAIITIWLHFANKGAGAFFFQERPGKNGVIFKICKFKSMTDECDSDGNLLPDEKRITKVGKFVRSTSIDELPQLWNVLIGDMSLIGPRPLLPRYLPYYTEREMHRHDVRPGITGWSQIHGRNHLSWDEQLESDVFYVEHISLKTDLKVMLATIKNVVAKKDIDVIPMREYLDIERKSKSLK
ncbi:MAG: sugar transferase [Muribaculaceae bacterium]|nr:sugar transferase [Muribaculaceae bacterium]